MKKFLLHVFILLLVYSLLIAIIHIARNGSMVDPNATLGDILIQQETANNLLSSGFIQKDSLIGFDVYYFSICYDNLFEFLLPALIINVPILIITTAIVYSILKLRWTVPLPILMVLSLFVFELGIYFTGQSYYIGPVCY